MRVIKSCILPVMKKLFNNIVDNILAKRIAIATGILLIVFFIGSLGYHHIEGVGYFEGFYETFITITTIGYSELKDISRAGRVLTMVVFVVGIGVISYIASQTTQLIFESEIFKQRAMRKQLEKIEDHYIVAGYGRIGHRIAEDLEEANIPLVIVENRDSSIERIEDEGLIYVDGNAQNEDVLREAGINRARGLVCALSSDQDNVFVTLVARELNTEIFILVRTNEHNNTKKILRAGANKVISPYEVGADRMANVILRPHVDQFMDRIRTDEGQDHIFDEVKISDGSELAGKTLAEADIRQDFFVVIIAIISDDNGSIQFNPGSNDELSMGDSLIVLGDVSRIKHLREEGCKDYRTLEERVSKHDFMKHVNFQRSNTPAT